MPEHPSESSTQPSPSLHGAQGAAPQAHPNVRHTVNRAYAQRERPLIPYNFPSPLLGVRIRVESLRPFIVYHGPPSRRPPARSPAHPTANPDSLYFTLGSSFSVSSPQQEPFYFTPPYARSFATPFAPPSPSSSDDARHSEYSFVSSTPSIDGFALVMPAPLQELPSTSQSSEFASSTSSPAPMSSAAPDSATSSTSSSSSASSSVSSSLVPLLNPPPSILSYFSFSSSPPSYSSSSSSSLSSPFPYSSSSTASLIFASNPLSYPLSPGTNAPLPSSNPELHSYVGFLLVEIEHAGLPILSLLEFIDALGRGAITATAECTQARYRILRITEPMSYRQE